PISALDAPKPMRLVNAYSSIYVPITVTHVVYPTYAHMHGTFEKHTTAFGYRMLRSTGFTGG
ncbi:hypothetical protein KI387_044583, partial [Taxus chinensis]